MKRIMIVDEHDIARRGLRDLLTQQPRVEVVAEARTGSEALDQGRLSSPDIAILAYDVPELNGKELTVQLRKMLPSIEILICTHHHGKQVLFDVVEAGARGFVLKSDPENFVLAAIDALSVRRPYWSESVREDLHQTRRRKHVGMRGDGITPRERDVLRLIAEGKLSKQIAHSLNISIKTVESHRSALMMKMNLRNTADVVRYALRNDLIAA